MTLMANPETISFDTVLTNMLKAGDGVSDLLFVVGRPPQVEVFGKLRPVDVPGFMPALQPAHTQGIAAKLVGDNERLKVDLKNNGSCDTSYAVPNVARFRVNVFRQNGNFGIVAKNIAVTRAEVRFNSQNAECGDTRPCADVGAVHEPKFFVLACETSMVIPEEFSGPIPFGPPWGICTLDE